MPYHNTHFPYDSIFMKSEKLIKLIYDIKKMLSKVMIVVANIGTSATFNIFIFEFRPSI